MKTILKSLAGLTLLIAISFSARYYLLPFGHHPSTEQKALIVDEIKTDRVGDVVYMYHVRDGKLVDFGGPHFVLLKANEIAASNHCQILSITTCAGHTVMGADVTVGVYVSLLPISDNRVAASNQP